MMEEETEDVHGSEGFSFNLKVGFLVRDNDNILRQECCIALGKVTSRKIENDEAYLSHVYAAQYLHNSAVRSFSG